jgi:hypothetical protein
VAPIGLRLRYSHSGRWPAHRGQPQLDSLLLAFAYSVPLWLQSLWVEVTRSATSVEPSTPGVFASIAVNRWTSLYFQF